LARRKGRFKEWVGAAVADMVAVFPYCGGWVAGAIVRFCRWTRAMVRVGYLDGTGDEQWKDWRKEHSRWLDTNVR